MFHPLLVTTRQLLRTPGSSALAILALGLGIGLVSTQFVLTEGILLRGLPFRDAGRLLHVGRASRDSGGEWSWMPLRDFEEFRRQQQAFSTFSAFSPVTLNYSGGPTPPRRFKGVLVTDDLFATLGARPLLGRDFRPGESAPGAPPLAILSHGAWQREFGGAEDVIGRSLRLNGEPATIIGVMGAGFHFPMNQEDVWVNLRDDRSETGGTGGRWVEAIGHLGPGRTRAAAAAELNGIAARLADRWPESNRDHRVMHLDTLPSAYAGGGTQPLLILLLAMTVFVLLLACGNVANLLLARTVGRTHELAIRAALGASRGRMLRHALGESLLLASLGGGVGIVLAAWGAALLNRHITQSMDVPFWFDFRLNAPVLLATCALTLGAGLLAGLVPALQAASGDVNAALKDGTRSGSGRWLRRFGRVLVVGQVALSTALLVGCGLLTGELIALKRVHIAPEPGQLISGRIELHEAGYEGTAARVRFYRRVVDQVAALPGVTAAAVSSRDLVNPGVAIRFEHEGVPYDRETDRPQTFLEVVSPEYFQVVGLGAVRGRVFGSGDTEGQPVVAVVNRSFAERHWPGQDPVGRRIRRHEDGAPWATVVGVVPDLPMHGLGSFTGGGSDAAGYYLCQDQVGWGWLHLLVRAAEDPGALVEPVRAAIAAVDPDQPIHAINTVTAISRRSVQGLQVVGTQSGIFGVVAAFLAAVGVFGVTSFSVSRRTREFGIRAALGADMPRITGLVLRQGTWELAAGLAAGLAMAFLMVQPIRSFLTQVSATNPVAYLGVAGFMGSVAFLAIWLPARRAARVDPVVALRSE